MGFRGESLFDKFGGALARVKQNGYLYTISSWLCVRLVPVLIVVVNVVTTAAAAVSSIVSPIIFTLFPLLYLTSAKCAANNAAPSKVEIEER